MASADIMEESAIPFWYLWVARDSDWAKPFEVARIAFVAMH